MAKFYDRVKLYNEVWEAPMREACKKYGISDIALAKICKKLRVAAPPKEYWAKKANGKAPKKPRLIKYDGAPKIPIRRTASPGIQDAEPRLNPEAFEEADNLIKTMTDITLIEDLENLHPYVRNTRKIFKRQLKKQYGNYYNRISVSGVDVFEISIGLESLDRATLILQTLCAAALTHEFEVVLDEERGVCFRIMDEKIIIKLSEQTKKMPISEKGKDPDKYYYRDYEYIPSGIFKLEINTDSFNMKERKSWSDTKTKQIEDKIFDIMHHLIRAAAWKKEYSAFKQKLEEERLIEANKRAERDRLNRIDEERISQLESGFKKWVYHKQMTEYVESVKSKYISENGEPSADFAEWVKWADKYLSGLNPLKGDFSKYDVAEFNPWLKV